MDVHLSLENKYVKKIMNFCKVTTANNVVRIALVILSWVMDEFTKGRQIYSCDPDGTNKKHLNLPWLENIDNNSKPSYEWICPGCGEKTISDFKPSNCWNCGVSFWLKWSIILVKNDGI